MNESMYTFPIEKFCKFFQPSSIVIVNSGGGMSLMDRKFDGLKPSIPTWRIIPVSKWLINMVSKSPKWGYSPYKRPKWLVTRGY